MNFDSQLEATRLNLTKLKTEHDAIVAAILREKEEVVVYSAKTEEAMKKLGREIDSREERNCQDLQKFEKVASQISEITNAFDRIEKEFLVIERRLDDACM